MDTGTPGELVQLLTPEGERIEHPDYAIDLSDSDYRALYTPSVALSSATTTPRAIR